MSYKTISIIILIITHHATCDLMVNKKKTGYIL